MRRNADVTFLTKRRSDGFGGRLPVHSRINAVGPRYGICAQHGIRDREHRGFILQSLFVGRSHDSRWIVPPFGLMRPSRPSEFQGRVLPFAFMLRLKSQVARRRRFSRSATLLAQRCFASNVSASGPATAVYHRQLGYPPRMMAVAVEAAAGSLALSPCCSTGSLNWINTTVNMRNAYTHRGQEAGPQFDPNEVYDMVVVTTFVIKACILLELGLPGDEIAMFIVNQLTYLRLRARPTGQGQNAGS